VLSNEHASKSGTFGVPGLVLLGRGTTRHKSGKSGTGGNTRGGVCKFRDAVAARLVSEFGGRAAVAVQQSSHDLAAQRSRQTVDQLDAATKPLVRRHSLCQSRTHNPIQSIIECIVVVLFCRSLSCMMFMCSVCLYFTVLP